MSEGNPRAATRSPCMPRPAEFAVAAEQAASARAASIVSAHTASQIVSIVTVLAADQPAAVAVADPLTGRL